MLLSFMQENFSILSLDGGGIRGIFTAALLAALEEDLNIDITDHFDLIAGTSTGGIIALALGLGLRPKEILSLYKDNACRIFPVWRRFLPNLFYFTKYSNKGLLEVLDENIKLNGKILGDSRKRLLVTSYSLMDDNVYTFRTAHHERLTRDYKLEISKVAAATSAAPTFFQTYKGIDGNRLIDGGVWANNPTMAAITESYGTLGVKLENTKVFSVGTTCADKTEYGEWVDRGVQIPWGLKISKLFLAAQANTANNQASFFIQKDKYLRVNFCFAGNELGLDSSGRLDDLYAAAKSESRKISNEFKNKFMNSKAADFSPLYKV